MENLCQIELNEGWNWLDWRVGSSHDPWYSRHDKTRSWPLEEEGWRVEGAWRSCGECNDPPISSSLLSSVRSAMQCNVNAVQLWSAHILPSPARSVSSLNFSLVGQCSILLVEDGLLLWTCGIGSPESWSSADPWRPLLAVGSHLFKARDGGQPVSGLLLKITILAPRSSGPHSSELRIVESQWAGRKQTGGPALPDDTEVIQNILSALYRHFFKSQ